MQEGEFWWAIGVRGLILAGGKGERMGREKGGMRHADGRTMVRRAADLLEEVGCERVVVSLREGQDVLADWDGLEVVRDAGEGPLGGMIAGLESGVGEDWLVVACDLPRLDVGVLKGLLGFEDDFVVYGSDRGLEPLCGYYGRGALGILKGAREAGRWGLQEILRESGVRVLGLEDERALENANTVEDFRRSFEVEVREIWISQGHDFRGRHGLGRMEYENVRVDEVVCEAGRGLVGDRYYDFKEDYKGQVSFFSWEVLEEMRRSYEGVRFADLRRNILVRGMDMEGLVDRIFEVQGVSFEGSEECKPCYWMEEAVGEGAEDFLTGGFRGGLRARIVGGGVLRVGR